MSVLIAIAAVAVVLAVLAVLVGLLITRLYRKVEQGQALVVNRVKDIDVTFSGALVIPVIHRAELMDVSVKRLDVDRRGIDGLICADHIRADVAVSFYIRVNPTKESVLEVAKLIGCSEASNISTLSSLFTAKFSEALKTVGKSMDFIDLYDRRVEFRDAVIEVIGNDLNGYSLDDVAIEYLEQTPLSTLDPNNILDAEGIRKITDITSAEAVTTNQLRRDAEKQTRDKDVETAQAIFELDRSEKEAQFRADRQVATTKATEEAATAIVVAEQRLAAENASLTADEQIGIRSEVANREIEVANRGRQRAVAVEDEKVLEAQALAEAARQAETARSNLAVETARTDLAHKTAERTDAERGVAEREEAITTLRVVEDASRTKTAAVTTAEGEAESARVLTVTTAEAEAAAERALGDSKAYATTALGEADGAATQARLTGEAAGLSDKADAMAKLEGVGQSYDQFVKELEANTSVRLAQVDASREIAAVQAQALGAALAEANIDIVGGTDMFVDRVLGAVNTGRQIDGVVAGSSVASAVAEPYLTGERDLVATTAAAVGGLGADGIRDLTLAGLITRLGASSGEGTSGPLNDILEALTAKGLDQLPVSEIISGAKPKG